LLLAASAGHLVRVKFRDFQTAMKIRPLQVIFASAAILAAAALAEALVPREFMARSSETFDLQKMIPRQFGEWTWVPGIRLIEPPGPDTLARQLYSQELSRGYRDREGHLVMLLVAYGPNQSNRLQLHRPELCYPADGFRVSNIFRTEIPYRQSMTPLKLTRMTAQREGRIEPVSYWMRIGNNVATSVVERQIIKLKYGLQGIIPDGVLIRVSTTGWPVEAAYETEDRFIRDFLSAVAPEDLKFFVGDRAQSL